MFDQIRVEHYGRVIESCKPDQEASSVDIGGFEEFITGTGTVAPQLLRRLLLQILEETGKPLRFFSVAAKAPAVVGPGEFSNSNAKAAWRQ